MEEERRKIGIILAFVALFAMLPFVSVGYASETPLIEEWNKTFGGTDYDTANSVQQISDGGYIFAGSTLSYGDYWNMLLVKTDSDGNKQWDRVMWGRPETDMMIECVQQTSDGGYILAGGISVSNRPWDFWLVKTDSNGNLQWDQAIGKIAKDDFAYSVYQTSDGGYILAGKSNALGDTPSDYDFRLVKTDSAGMPLWDRYIDAGNTEEAYSVQQTPDGGYILAGETYGRYYMNALLVKTYSNGKVNWSMTFGGTGRDMAYSVQQTSDGGYILAGFTDSYGAGSFDFWLVKTDSNGNESWNKTFGGIGSEKAKSVWQTSDGGYILAGYTTSYGSGSTDAWLVKTGSNGNEQWNKTFGGTRGDRANSVQQTADDSYILAGETYSYGAGSADAWLIKVGAFIFDTGEGAYPSICGTHRGTITPSYNITVSKLYTYACAGTGGHTESIELYDENGTLIANGTWNGYIGDYHNITIHNLTGEAPYVTLLKNLEYRYVIKTGSYPQIIHAKSKEVTGGTIIGDQFIDANGKIYTDWIPAIKLF